MINRRRVLQSCLGFTAGYAVVRLQTAVGQTAIGRLSTSLPHADNSSRTLIELLQNAIQVCHDGSRLGLVTNQREVAVTRQLCQQAITRVQRSSRDTPAFWQACSDSVSRLEAAVSARISATHIQASPLSSTLHQLRSLKNNLVIQTVQAIGVPS